MSDTPRIVVDDPLFRIVKVEEGERVVYVWEVPDGCDALGVERWREFKGTENKHIRALRDYIIRGADHAS